MALTENTKFSFGVVVILAGALVYQSTSNGKTEEHQSATDKRVDTVTGDLSNLMAIREVAKRDNDAWQKQMIKDVGDLKGDIGILKGQVEFLVMHAKKESK